MPTHEIIPAILCQTPATAKRRIALVAPYVKTVQIDIMDGTLVPETCWHNPSDVASWNMDVRYELHLMISNPIAEIERWSRVKRVDRVLIHAETPKKLAHLIEAARAHVKQIGLVISPGTPLKKILPYLDHIDAVQVMGGVPGKGGQKLDLSTIETVEIIRTLKPRLPIGFDIGVNAKTIPMLAKAGVTRFCSGKAIFSSANPIEVLQKMQELI
jgi:ribulose-phosphate 3-epimerase